MKSTSIIIAISAIFILGSITGCASKSTDIPATYVSPNEYASFSCLTLENELSDLSRRVATITGQVDSEASGDAWQMGVGLVLFWPSLFFLEGGDGNLQNEYALLKGKYEAVNTQHKRKNCADEGQTPEING
ncbi:hypothetical protein BAE46_10905 [Glaciecola punicea]|uniref:hypothetical protein n=1 Tax=Glaciecola punicea TaxID=56804 RepID=UPI0008730751|nr:hypothetical protein [Glaciecola punicea]OFA30470.1 hypothetical protein BAE46_10905 [Glaciecola punicea]